MVDDVSMSPELAGFRTPAPVMTATEAPTPTPLDPPPELEPSRAGAAARRIRLAERNRRIGSTADSGQVDVATGRNPAAGVDDRRCRLGQHRQRHHGVDRRSARSATARSARSVGRRVGQYVEGRRRPAEAHALAQSRGAALSNRIQRHRGADAELAAARAPRGRRGGRARRHLVVGGDRHRARAASDKRNRRGIGDRRGAVAENNVGGQGAGETDIRAARA